MNPSIEKLKLLDGREREKILEKLSEQFGISEIPGVLFRRGTERIFLYSGSFDEDEVRRLEKVTFIERVGVYLGKEHLGEIRLSIEGSQVLKPFITQRVVELSREEMETWMMGHEVLKKTGFHGFVIMSYAGDFLGTGNASEEKITNFIPKSRRLRDKTIEK